MKRYEELSMGVILICLQLLEDVVEKVSQVFIYRVSTTSLALFGT